ncbi:hypothetical protein ABK040_015570 [Willaertia magna]
MNTKIFAVFCLIAVLAATAFAYPSVVCKKQSRLGDNALPAEILAFLEGFVLGLDAEVANITLCTQDAKITLTDLQNGFRDIEGGIKSISVKQVERGLQEFGAGVQEIAVALRDCNVTEIVREIETIAQELQSGASGIVKVIAHEVVNIFHHEKDIVSDFKKAIEYWKQRKFELCGVQVGKIVGILLK